MPKHYLKDKFSKKRVVVRKPKALVRKNETQKVNKYTGKVLTVDETTRSVGGTQAMPGSRGRGKLHSIAPKSKLQTHIAYKKPKKKAKKVVKSKVKSVKFVDVEKSRSVGVKNKRRQRRGKSVGGKKLTLDQTSKRKVVM